MSEHSSQQDLYKDKCLYTVLNILLSKVQRLEKKVAILEVNNCNKIYNKHNKTKSNEYIMNYINKLELKVNEQSKLLNQLINNKEQDNNNSMLSSELDNYLKDIDEIMEFQINDIPELEKLKEEKDKT